MEKQSDSDTIFEEREELMVSPTGGGNPTLRKAHFLKPTATSIDGKVSELPPLSHTPNKLPACHVLTELSEKVSFGGWKRPTEAWKRWVGEMHGKNQALWKQVGIYEAIMSSRYEMKRHKEVVLGLVEKWCPKTNTFVFGWGEATITLEDLMVLGGYPVLGQSVLSLDLNTKQEIEVEEKLEEARKAAATAGALLATHKAWVEHFKGSGNDIEHEAFLSLWLSKFVLTTAESSQRIGKHVFPIAIHLARGNRVALAPAVLSSIYRDLTLLKDWAFGSNVVQTNEILNIHAPFQLVLLWVWERFPSLRPMPNSFSLGEPRVARWHKLTMKVGDMKLAIDSAEDSFQWRPYAVTINDWTLPTIYSDKELYTLIGSCMDNELQSIARCLRVSELVGLGCIEQYLPHRVAMQFGMDQDIPASVARCNKNPEIAWRNYSRPIQDTLFYLPARLFESDVTERYSNWWKQLILRHCDATKRSANRPTSPTKSLGGSSSKKQSCTLSFSDDLLNCKGVSRGDSTKGNDMEDQMTVREWLAYSKHRNAQIVMDGENVSASLDAQSPSFSTKETETLAEMDADIKPGEVGREMSLEGSKEYGHKIGCILPAKDLPLAAAETQNVSTSFADKGDVSKIKSEVKQVEEAAKNECSTGGSQGLLVDDFKTKLSRIDDIESRICRLEKQCAELKKRRLHKNRN